ncbi:PIG-L deacetylase family protein [Methylocapsa sp. S129]|uniref:PIG-L deacetylase family protein n=1 Tax=Methylocapsa sp. S129 TaxID=1641869 RepID=UPI00131E83A0|nr:PIG-L family deacetylase [Methylocapsa sp. S129]
MFGRRILIFVPHPDDEVVACAAAIGRAKGRGAEVFAAYLTDGCLARDTVWPWRRGRHADDVARRRAEGEAAAASLGLSSVGWSARPTRRLWRELPQVHNEMRAAIEACGPDQIWLPAYEGGNPDHDGLNALGQLFRDQLSVLEFAEYNFFGAKAQAQRFPFPDGGEQTIDLTPNEQARKSDLLRLYASERQNLNYVGTARECWRKLASYDYSRPPHPGTLWYARHQWVPFRHPRVDFTRPEEVSAAIGAYLKAAGRPMGDGLA